MTAYYSIVTEMGITDASNNSIYVFSITYVLKMITYVSARVDNPIIGITVFIN